jgi:hypothetical protein
VRGLGRLGFGGGEGRNRHLTNLWARGRRLGAYYEATWIKRFGLADRNNLG